jgi:hypothetical protein
MWGWLTALVRGLADSFWGWFSAYRQGRLAERVNALEAGREVDQKIADALAALRQNTGDFELGPDGRVRRRIPVSPPGVPEGTEPDAK